MNRPSDWFFAAAFSLAACMPQIVDKQRCEAPGDCLDGYSCVEGTCVATSMCVPKTCETAQAECGEVSDGCGATVDCGENCAAPLRCGGDGRANRCGYVAEGWSVETIRENCESCTAPNLAIDPAGNPYVNVLSSADGLWLYAPAITGWSPSRLSVQIAIMSAASLAVDSLGKPYVVSGTGSAVDFRYRSEKGWESVVAIPAKNPFDFASGVDLFFDGNDMPHVCFVRRSFLDVPSAELVYAAYRANVGWSEEVVPVGNDVLATDCEIAFDPMNRVHVVFSDSKSMGLIHAVKEAGAWTFTPLFPGAAGPDYFSMSLGMQGEPVIGFHQPSDSTVRVATLRDGNWTSEVVDTVASYAAFTSVAVDASGSIHMSYYQPKEAGYLKYATNAGGTWVAQAVAVGGALVLQGQWGQAPYWTPGGGYTALALDAGGKPRIVYFDATRQQIRFAKRL